MFTNGKSYQYPLVAIGDSLSQGFKNGGIYRTDLSFPAMLARAMGVEKQFEIPSFTAQTGIPINMEMLVRGLSDEVGDTLSWHEYMRAGRHLFRTLRRIKSYWNGSMKSLHVERHTPYHNQSIWGVAISDSWLLDDLYAKEHIRHQKDQYSVFSVLPDHAMYTTARMVLNPCFAVEREKRNMLDNLEELHTQGGVENLICCIGHNNIVGAVTNLKLVFSDGDDLNTAHGERNCTIFRPEHFEDELRILYQKIAKLNIPRVFVPTLPYLTIPPAIRGLNLDRSAPKGHYFDYYTRFWIWDADFNPDRHPHLTRDEAILIDQHIDQYNATICSLAKEFGFHSVPVGAHVQAVARRRLGAEQTRPFPPDFLGALRRNPNTSYLVDDQGRTRISTDYFRLCDGSDKIDRGGIFSLDGLHPSTIGYGLIANIYKRTMSKAGVRFEHPLDWDHIIESETLVTHPPVILKDLRRLLRYLAMGRSERFSRIGQNVLQQVLEQFSTAAEVETKE
ncbi:MAG: hypothetical protein ACNA78_02185 [Balneolaceae bacterium]